MVEITDLPGELTGVVTDADTQQPLDNAVVKVKASNDSTVTGSDGSYLLKNLHETSYEIQASKKAYETGTQNVSVPAANTAQADFALKGIPYHVSSDLFHDFSIDFTERYFTISNEGAGSFNYVVSTGVNWISIDPQSGTVSIETDTIRVTINRTGLPDHKIEERITITANIGQSPQQYEMEVYVNGVADRDGNHYRIVTIGTQTWMAENLNTGNIILYPNDRAVTIGAEQSDNNIIEEYCYGNDDRKCEDFGGLISWGEAMGNAPSDTGAIGTTQGICPAGWHIPTLSEWEVLFEFCGGESLAGRALKSTGNLQDGTGLWKYSPDSEGTDQLGFNILPVGNYVLNTEADPIEWLFAGIRENSAFWSSYYSIDGAQIERAQHMQFGYNWDNVRTTYPERIQQAFLSAASRIRDVGNRRLQ